MYLPSYLSQTERDQKLSTQSMHVEKGFRITARRLAESCEHSVYEKLPDLKDIVRLLQGLDNADTIEDIGLFGALEKVSIENNAQALLQGGTAKTSRKQSQDDSDLALSRAATDSEKNEQHVCIMNEEEAAAMAKIKVHNLFQ